MRHTKVLLIITMLFTLVGCRQEETVTRESFIPNKFDYSKLSGDEILTYEDDEYRSVAGIDVSEHQRNIDFNRVKNAGIEFVYMRLGYRGTTEGKVHLDQYFELNYAKARLAGLNVGFYFFSQAINEKEAREEARFVLENIANKGYDLPIVFDYEDAGEGTRANDLTREQYTNNALAFMDEIIKNGHKAMIYLNLNWTYNYYDMTKILDYDIWFAQYNSVPMFPYPFTIWQYSEDGKVDGIYMPVDLDIMFIRKNAQQ